MVMIGLWWDLGSGHTVKRADQYAAQLKELGISHVATMLTDSELSDGHLDWKKWTPSRLKTWGDALARQCMTTTWTMYAWPTRDLIDELLAGLDALLELDQPGRLELDLEGAWRARYLDGFASLAEAGSSLVAELRSRAPVVEVTSYPLHREMGPAVGASTVPDIICPQAYSYRDSKGDPARDWLGRFGPGAMQRLAMSRVAHRAQRVVLGLAAWAQTWRGHPAPEGMRVALDTALGYPIDEIRYWSAKHVLGPMANDYAADFIEGIRMAA